MGECRNYKDTSLVKIVKISCLRKPPSEGGVGGWGGLGGWEESG
jgi:hypothetical protein